MSRSIYPVSAEKPAVIEPQHARIAVIGGGISGLAAANRIRELNKSAEVVLLEAGPRLGGVLRTECRDGFLIEYGADNFITSVPWAVDFCRRIGFERELVATNPTHRRAFVVRGGKLRPIPAGFAVMAPSRVWPVLSTPILSPVGKLRLGAELLIRRRESDADESMAAFATRRLGRETYERLVQPLVAGIYTADPTKLSVQATMPRFCEMEKSHGSLIRAMWKKNSSQPQDKQTSGARYSQFVAPRDGMSALVKAVASRLPNGAIRKNSPVEQLQPRADHGWCVQTADQRFEVDGIVLALPSPQCARLLRSLDAELARDLAGIEYGSCALATLGFRREQIQHALDGFGFVVPLTERRKVLSASFSSIKYPGRAPDGEVLIRTFIGGACQKELLELDDRRLLEIAQQELSELLGISGRPRMVHINRQIDAMPQYHVGHRSLVERITQHLNRIPGITLASNSLGGVGLPHCIHTAEVAAEQLLEKCDLRSESSAPTICEGA